MSTFGDGSFEHPSRSLRDLGAAFAFAESRIAELENISEKQHVRELEQLAELAEFRREKDEAVNQLVAAKLLRTNEEVRLHRELEQLRDKKKLEMMDGNAALRTERDAAREAADIFAAMPVFCRCARHYAVPKLNATEATGSECGACIDEDRAAAVKALRDVANERDQLLALASNAIFQQQCEAAQEITKAALDERDVANSDCRKIELQADRIARARDEALAALRTCRDAASRTIHGGEVSDPATSDANFAALNSASAVLAKHPKP